MSSLEIMHDSSAIRRAQQGDAGAFEQLYSLHRARVYRLCLKMTHGDTSLSEDLTQEAFLQVYRKIKTFRGDSAFATWLHRVAFNVVLMHLRRNFIKEESFDEPRQQDDGPVKKDFGTCDLRLKGATDRATIGRVLDSLPPGYRMIFVLHDIYGYEHNEIAEILCCSIGNSKSQLHKAREKVRLLLAAENPNKNNGKIVSHPGTLNISAQVREAAFKRS